MGNKKGKNAQRAAKRASSLRSAQRVDALLYGGGAFVAFLTAVLAGYYIYAEQSAPGRVVALSASGDPEGLKVALFGGEPWVILCSDSSFNGPKDGNDGGGEIDGKNIKLEERAAKVFRESAQRVAPFGITFGTLDCSVPLQSKSSKGGLNVYKRFKLNKKRAPVVFMVAGGDMPRQLNPAALTSRQTNDSSLATTVKQLAKKRFSMVRVGSSKMLQEKCAGRKACGLFLGYGDPPTTLKKVWKELVEKHRKIRWAWADLLKVKFSLAKKLPRSKSDTTLRFVLFRKTSKEKMYAAYDRTFDSSDDAFVVSNEISQFLKDAVDNELFTSYKKYPALISKGKAKVAKKRSDRKTSKADESTASETPKFTAERGKSQAEVEMERRLELDRQMRENYPEAVDEAEDDADGDGDDRESDLVDLIDTEDDVVLLEDDYYYD